MKKQQASVNNFRWLEIGIALLATSLIILFQWMYITHAGGLWRDEVNSINLVHLPTVSSIYRNLGYDSFPMFWFLVLRCWSFAGFAETDFTIRLLGLIIALSVFAVLWWNAKQMSYSVPMISLLLLGFNPAIIRALGENRAYGLGILLMLVTYGLIWNLIETPSRRLTIGTLLASFLCVHCIYYNLIFLFAMLLGAVLILARHRAWQQIWKFVGIGAICVVSMLIYVPVIQMQHQWGYIVSMPVDFLWICVKLFEALTASGKFVGCIWIGLFLFTLFIILYARDARSNHGLTLRQKDLFFFSVTVMLVSMVGFSCFLKILQYRTFPWYYADLMALMAMSFDIIIGAISQNKVGSVLKSLFAMTLMGLTFLPTWTGVQSLQTNTDIIAAKIQQQGSKGDLIVVNPWYFAISFERYYHGDLPFMTIPDFSDHRFGGPQYVLQKMKATNPINGLQSQILQTLQNGHKVWVVGGLPDLSICRGKKPPPISPAPDKRWGWESGKYLLIWALQCRSLMESQGATGHTVRVWDGRAIMPDEAASLEVYQIGGRTSKTSLR